jgi:hypothetical protein
MRGEVSRLVHLAAALLAARPIGVGRVPPHLDPPDSVPNCGHCGRRRARSGARHRDASDQAAARFASLLATSFVWLRPSIVIGGVDGLANGTSPMISRAPSNQHRPHAAVRRRRSIRRCRRRATRWRDHARPTMLRANAHSSSRNSKSSTRRPVTFFAGRLPVRQAQHQHQTGPRRGSGFDAGRLPRRTSSSTSAHGVRILDAVLGEA